MFTFRLATISDCLLIQTLASQTWENTYKNILSKDQLDYMFQMMYSIENIQKQMTELHHTFFIVENDSKPCAYCSIEKKDEHLFNFQKIYAIPDVQGKGIGRFMIEQGIAYIKRTFPEASKIELYVNRFNPAVEFYKHIGFVIEDTRDHSIGNNYFMNDFIMVKNI